MHIRLNNDVLEMFCNIWITTWKDINQYLKNHLSAKNNKIDNQYDIEKKLNFIIDLITHLPELDYSNKDLDDRDIIDWQVGDVTEQVVDIDPWFNIPVPTLSMSNKDQLQQIINKIEWEPQITKQHIKEKWWDKYKIFLEVKSKWWLQSDNWWIGFDERITIQSYPNSNILRDIESWEFTVD